MTENLRLVFAGDYVGKYNSSTNTITATTTQITPENSDVSTTFLPGNTTETASTKTKWTATSTGTEAETNTIRSYRDNVMFNDGDGLSQNSGAYYNWYTVTASTGTYNVHGGSIASSSICPKNFILPNVWTNYGWSKLLNVMYGKNNGTDESVVTAITKFPISAIWSGYYNSSAAAMTGGNANSLMWTKRSYGTSDVSGYQQAYVLLANKNTNYFNSTNGYSKWIGIPVRCMVRVAQ